MSHGFKHHTFISLALLTSITLVGCASTKPTYVSSAVYNKYDCNQLAQEYTRVNRAIGNQSGGSILKSTGVNVGISAGRGGVYPSVSLGLGNLGGGRSNATLSRLLGEKEAITQAAKNKSCNFIIAVQQSS